VSRAAYLALVAGGMNNGVTLFLGKESSSGFPRINLPFVEDVCRNRAAI
jgi:hypothetical protein